MLVGSIWLLERKKKVFRRLLVLSYHACVIMWLNTRWILTDWNCGLHFDNKPTFHIANNYYLELLIQVLSIYLWTNSLTYKNTNSIENQLVDNFWRFIEFQII